MPKNSNDILLSLAVVTATILLQQTNNETLIKLSEETNLIKASKFDFLSCRWRRTCEFATHNTRQIRIFHKFIPLKGK